MVRWLFFAIVVVAVSALATLGLPYLNASKSDTSYKPPFPLASTDQGLLPKVVIEGESLTHDFGVMGQQSSGEHEWTITNKGEGDLLLSKGPSTCSCTIANLESDKGTTLKPGESTKVKLTWETRTNNGKFEKSASVLTNDPTKPKIDFIIDGTVRPAISLLPPIEGLVYYTIPNDHDHPKSFLIHSDDRPDFKITKAISSNPDLIKVETHPVPPEDAKKMEVASGKAYRVDVIVKPGSALGSFREEVVLTTDHPLKPEVKLPVSGKIAGPISSVPERIRLTQVLSKNGADESVILWVRGQEHTKFVIEKSPENLKVDIQPTDDKTDSTDATAKSARYTLTIKVPPGTPPGAINDEIILKTDHPRAATVRIPVNVLILGAS